jgi:hypothetical protein
MDRLGEVDDAAVPLIVSFGGAATTRAAIGSYRREADRRDDD